MTQTSETNYLFFEDREALVLAGGGARAAYQVGVLQAIAEWLPEAAPCPFQVLVGTSAGAINASALTARADRLRDGVRALERVWAGFSIEQVVQTDRRAIFVSRRGDPRIVLFGSPLRCRENLFVESPDKAIVLNSKPEQNYVSVIRKHPMRPGIIGPTRTGFGLAGLIRLLGKEPTGSPGGWIDGLDVPYMEVITLLEQMVAREAVDAQFWAGPVPEVGLIIKK